MTIPEAAQLVIQAGALANASDIFLLDMGDSVKIIDLARRMVELSGLRLCDDEHPDGDIKIQEIGLRPGEKLYEELLIEGDPDKTAHPRIFKASEQYIPWKDFETILGRIEQAIESNDVLTLRSILLNYVGGYNPSSS
jgi:FlaA1/EpsC-like NDP-sugar epimerase